MSRYKILISSILCFSLAIGTTMAKENVGEPKGSSQQSGKASADCQPGTSQTDLDVNNVRTRLLTGGDYWWNLSDARYEIPKVEPGSGQPSVHSLFAGALWIGGLDAGSNQLKIAAQTYRQTGNDFWPGPLDAGGNITEAECSAYDRHWKVNRSDINEMIELNEQFGGSIPIANVPRVVLEWPGRGSAHAVGANATPLNILPSKNLAPFVDVDGDGLYDPTKGDYPDVLGDQAIWWVYNDRGNVHSESGGEAIGLEVQAMAFAFSTNDEINDMTFYSYTINNFSTSVLDSVYFGQWVDADLGYAFDDFVGVDAGRALGICYNGDAVDGPAAVAYGANPPIVGVDFFQGPTKYTYDGTTGAIIDSTTLGMSKFLFYDNDFQVTGNPEVASHYYGYLSGTWKDGSPFTFGGGGHGGTTPTDYMFPDDPGSGGWSECDENRTPFDRRFVQSAGAFRLDPGAENEVIVGAVWVRPSSQSGCLADFDAIRIADDKAQALFDNNFELVDGPPAPDLAIRELDQKVILSLEGTQEIEAYEEADPIIKSIIENLNDPNITDSTYNFEGYIIYQLKDAQVSASEFRDVNRARIVAQVDVENNVSKIVNYTFDPILEADVPQLMVTGNNAGIRHTFVVTEDAFATGARGLVNHKTYYFAVVSYAHNDFLPYSPGDSTFAIAQRLPYLEGRGNIKVYSAIPHKPAPENGGLVLNSDYGDGPNIIRIEGKGNGGNVLDLTPESVDEIVASGFMPHPVYQKTLGPVDVKVYDPVKVPNAEFELQFLDNGAGRTVAQTARWQLTNTTTGEVIHSDRTIAVGNEQIIPEWGLAVSIRQLPYPGENRFGNNSFLEATKVYENPGINWLTAVPEGEGRSNFNWIRSGSFDNDEPTGTNLYDDYVTLDPDQVYEDVIGGTWAPFALFGGLVAGENYMPVRNVAAITNFVKIDSLVSVDVVLTPDKTKWTRCIVVEQAEDPTLAQGSQRKMTMREHPSWTGEVDANGAPIYDPVDMGRSYFPGYAINVETGERLNIIFGEDSWLAVENGADMIWNPTSNLTQLLGTDVRFGGKHFIYISNTRYDEGAAFQQAFLPTLPTNTDPQAVIRSVFSSVVWGSTAMLASGHELASIEEGIVPTETTIRLRVAVPYQRFHVNGANGGYPMYQFGTSDLAADTGVAEVAESALDLIKAVPNPYYAYSEYEQSQLDNRIKITNLPPNATVTIYNTAGELIRTFQREVPGNVSSGAPTGTENFDTSIDWDLRNNRDVPVASGMYIIHVEAPGIGEKVVRWFGVMRPIDLDTF